MLPGNKPILFVAFAALALTALTAPHVSAQSINGVNLKRQDFDPSHPDVTHITDFYSSPTLFTEAFKAAWRAAKPTADRELEKMIGENQRYYGKGITLYQQQSQLTSEGDVSTKIEGDKIVLTFVLKRNVLIFKSTTPTVFGSYADPKLSVTYDLSLKATIPIPTITKSLKVESAIVTVSNGHLDSQNLPADILNGFNSLLAFFGGPNFKALAEARIYKQVDFAGSINQALNPLNNSLMALSRQGYGLLESLVIPQNHTLRLTSIHNPIVPQAGTGAIAGIIRWKKSYGHPRIPLIAAPGLRSVSFADGLLINAAVQTGARGSTSFDGPTQNLGKVEWKDVTTAGSDMYEFQYTISNLPMSIPIRVEVKDSNRFRWEAGSDPLSRDALRYFRPSGWGGIITLTPPRAGSSGRNGFSTLLSGPKTDFEMFLQDQIH